MSNDKLINVYDFDHTIYHGDASLDFILYCLRHNPRLVKYLVPQGMALVKYALGRVSRKQIKQVAFAFLRDLDNPEQTVLSFWDTHQSKIKPWYTEQKHKTDLIISASPEFLLKPIAARLSIASPIATIMDIHTGQITGENCRADEKVERLYAYDPTIKIATCYSDSMSDTPLLKLANKAYLVKKHQLTELRRDSLG